MLKINLRGLSSLITLTNKFQNMEEDIKVLVADELIIFAEEIRSDNTIPREYANALFVSVVPEYKIVVLSIDVPEKYAFEKFGSRVEWAVYKCKRRKYFGGTLTEEYNGPNYIQQKWVDYKNTFIARVKSGIAEIIKR